MDICLKSQLHDLSQEMADIGRQLKGSMKDRVVQGMPKVGHSLCALQPFQMLVRAKQSRQSLIESSVEA